MELFIYGVTDTINFVTVLVACSMFFSFQRRDAKNQKCMLDLTFLIIVVSSLFVFFCDNHILKALIYVVIIIVLLFLLYREKLFRILIVSLGVIFALSLIEIMTSSLVDIIISYFNFNGAIFSDLAASLISLFLVYFVGKIYRKNISSTQNSMGIVNMIGFTMLLIIDNFVVSVIKNQPFTDLYTEKQRSLFLLALCLVILGIFIQLASVILLFTQRNVYKEKEALTDKYLNEQKSHYEYLENREKETKKFRHDLKSHMEMISNLAKECQYDKMNAYLEQMNIRIDDFGNVVTVHNGIVDAIINQYNTKAQECGVHMEVKGRFPVDCAIDAFDLCTIFSNVLSNALEAAKETEEKYILVECVYTEMTIMIIVSNSYKPDAVNGGGQWKTRKADLNYHGYGLENIKDSVEKYKGDLDIETKDNIFSLRILFSYMEMQNHENSNCG